MSRLLVRRVRPDFGCMYRVMLGCCYRASLDITSRPDAPVPSVMCPGALWQPAARTAPGTRCKQARASHSGVLDNARDILASCSSPRKVSDNITMCLGLHTQQAVQSMSLGTGPAPPVLACDGPHYAAAVAANAGRQRQALATLHLVDAVCQADPHLRPIKAACGATALLCSILLPCRPCPQCGHMVDGLGWPGTCVPQCWCTSAALPSSSAQKLHSGGGTPPGGASTVRLQPPRHRTCTRVIAVAEAGQPGSWQYCIGCKLLGVRCRRRAPGLPRSLAVGAPWSGRRSSARSAGRRPCCCSARPAHR